MQAYSKLPTNNIPLKPPRSSFLKNLALAPTTSCGRATRTIHLTLIEPKRISRAGKEDRYTPPDCNTTTRRSPRLIAAVGTWPLKAAIKRRSQKLRTTREAIALPSRSSIVRLQRAGCPRGRSSNNRERTNRNCYRRHRQNRERTHDHPEAPPPHKRSPAEHPRQDTPTSHARTLTRQPGLPGPLPGQREFTPQASRHDRKGTRRSRIGRASLLRLAREDETTLQQAAWRMRSGHKK